MSDRRFSGKYLTWRTAVLVKYKSKCNRCGSKNRLQAHHIKSWEDYPELRFSVNNGKCVCYCCHVNIHPYMVEYEKKVKKKKRKSKKKSEQIVHNKEINKGKRLSPGEKKAYLKESKFKCKKRYSKSPYGRY